MMYKGKIFRIPDIDVKQSVIMFVSFVLGVFCGLAILNASDFSIVNEFNFSISNSGFWIHFRFHILSVVFGASALGVFFLPFVSFCKGFSVSVLSFIFFAFSKFALNAPEFLYFFIWEICSTVLLLLIGCFSFSSSIVLFRGVFLKRDYFRREYVLCCIVFSLFLFLISLIFNIFFILF